MIATRIERSLMKMNKRREAALRAIAKHAGRVKSGKSHFTIAEHMNAIQRLANFGIDVDTKGKYG